jgi:hypothetical protein
VQYRGLQVREILVAYLQATVITEPEEEELAVPEETL